MPKEVRTKKRTTVEEMPVGGEWEDERPKEEMVSSDDLAMEEAARDLADSEKYIKLYRVNEQGGRPRFLAHMIPEEFSEGFIADRFGGGRYFGRWKMESGAYKRYPFEIEGEPFPVARKIPRIQEEEEEPVFVPTVEPSNNQTLGAGDVIRLIQDARKDAREEMRMLMEMMRPAAPPPQATDQVFSLVEKIVPLINSGGGETNPWLFALSQLKEPLTKLVDTAHAALTNHQTMQRPVMQAAPTPPAAAQPIAPQAATPQSEDDVILNMVRPYLGMLTTAAKTGSDPALYAEMILDQVPESLHNQLKEWLSKEGCLDKIALLAPAIRYQAAWWEELRTTILQTLAEKTDNAIRTIQPDENTDAPTVDSGSRTESD